MNGRRNFVKGFGLLSAVLAGGAVANTVPNPDLTPVSQATDPSIVAQLEEESTNINLQRTYGEIAPPEPQPSSQYLFSGINKKYVPGTEKQVNVKMAPGPDGELYLNLNGIWKRVLTA